MNTFMTIMSLILLAVMSWLAGYTACMVILSLSRWPARLNMEERFSWRRARKINRTIASVVGLIVAVVVMYCSAPSTIQSLQENSKVEGPQRPDRGWISPKLIERVDPVYPQEGIEQQIEASSSSNVT